jgi:hypothetical protein
MSRTPEQYLSTLQRIPDDIILAIAAQDFEEGSPARCVCGWAVRESIARAAGIDADTVELSSCLLTLDCVERFGGERDEWLHIYYGVMDFRAPAVETAFVDRLNEIVR